MVFINKLWASMWKNAWQKKNKFRENIWRLYDKQKCNVLTIEQDFVKHCEHRPDMMVNTWWLRQKDRFEFEANLGYKVNSWQIKFPEGVSVSWGINKTKTTKQTFSRSCGDSLELVTWWVLTWTTKWAMSQDTQASQTKELSSFSVGPHLTGSCHYYEWVLRWVRMGRMGC